MADMLLLKRRARRKDARRRWAEVCRWLETEGFGFSSDGTRAVHLWQGQQTLLDWLVWVDASNIEHWYLYVVLAPGAEYADVYHEITDTPENITYVLDLQLAFIDHIGDADHQRTKDTHDV